MDVLCPEKMLSVAPEEWSGSEGWEGRKDPSVLCLLYLYGSGYRDYPGIISHSAGFTDIGPDQTIISDKGSSPPPQDLRIKWKSRAVCLQTEL